MDRRWIALMMFVCLAGCSVPPQIPHDARHRVLAMQIRLDLDQGYQGWAFTRLDMPTLYGNVRADASDGYSNTAPLQAWNATYYNRRHIWTAPVVITQNSQTVTIFITEQMGNDITNLAPIPIDASIFQEHTVVVRGGVLRYRGVLLPRT